MPELLLAIALFIVGFLAGSKFARRDIRERIRQNGDVPQYLKRVVLQALDEE